MQSKNTLVKNKNGEFIKIIADTDLLKEFNIDGYLKIIKNTIVFEGDKIIATLLERTEIEVLIE